jgi:ATP phosphoribosyltransferase regulatory subunit
MSQALLPTGCYDLLPPYARQETQLSSQLLDVFESYGYEQVSPPLLEFSDNLLAGRGASLSDQIFRVMDPAALKVMGIRPDMTLQIARIASSRLADAARPLRLCYHGLIMRMKAQALSSYRQLRQVGIELIGVSHPQADAEVVMVAAHALRRIGIVDLSIDISLPPLVTQLLNDTPLSEETREQLLKAVQQKDTAAVASYPFDQRDLLIALMKVSGPARNALASLARIKLPASIEGKVAELVTVVDAVLAEAPDHWNITLDITETTAMNYHTGPCFSFFLPGSSVEIGRGGRYTIQSAAGNESATGFTLYLETVMASIPAPTPAKKILLSPGTPRADLERLQQEGYITIQGVHLAIPLQEQAQALGCMALFSDGILQPVTGKKS